MIVLNKVYFLLGIVFILIGIFLIIFSLGAHKNGKFAFIGLIGPFPIIIVDNKIAPITIFIIFLFLILLVLLFLFFFY